MYVYIIEYLILDRFWFAEFKTEIGLFPYNVKLLRKFEKVLPIERYQLNGIGRNRKEFTSVFEDQHRRII